MMNLLIQLCLKYYTGTYKVPTLRLLKTPELISVRRLPCRFKLEIDLSEKSPPVGSCVNLLPLRSLEVPKEVNYFNDMCAREGSLVEGFVQFHMHQFYRNELTLLEATIRYVYIHTCVKHL